jgi:hypothetical protein
LSLGAQHLLLLNVVDDAYWSWTLPFPEAEIPVDLASADDREAAASYKRALEFACQPAERRFLQARLAQVAIASAPPICT